MIARKHVRIFILFLSAMIRKTQSLNDIQLMELEQVISNRKKKKP